MLEDFALDYHWKRVSAAGSRSTPTASSGYRVSRRGACTPSLLTCPTG
jgi:hypothetical protein